MHCAAFVTSTQAPGGHSAWQFRNQQANRNTEYNILYTQLRGNQQAYRKHSILNYSNTENQCKYLQYWVAYSGGPFLDAKYSY